MVRILSIVYFSLSICFCASAQKVIQGKVLTSDSHKPIVSANVFLSNTTIGAITNENGEFVISHIPEGKFDLVVSFVGYESYVLAVYSTRLPSYLDIVLKPKFDELQEVIVEPYEKNGWEKWGDFFMQNFMGTTAFYQDCKLVNKETIKFRLNKKENILKAVANEQLVIVNNALGYRLKYDLTRFEFNFGTKIFLFQGYPLFEEIETKRDGLKKKWMRNRDDAYYGSIMHFMRSLFRNRLLEEKFEVRKLIKIPDTEQKRVMAIYQAVMKKTAASGRTFDRDLDIKANYPDSAAYYKGVLQHPENMSVLINKILPGDSIAFAIDSNTAGLAFKDYLQIVYPPKLTPVEYQKFLHKGDFFAPITSEIFLTSHRPISIVSNGNYFEPTDIISSGYWAWSEKISNMLPSDFKPFKK